MIQLVNPHFRVMNNQDRLHPVQFGIHSRASDLTHLGSKNTSITECTFLRLVQIFREAHSDSCKYPHAGHTSETATSRVDVLSVMLVLLP